MLTRRLQGVLTAHQYVLMDYDIPISKVAAAVAVTPGFESPTISPLHDKQWNARASHGSQGQGQPADG